MGTNYYYCPPSEENLVAQAENTRPPEQLHIGKSSGGWCFSLSVNPEQGISNLDDWEALWRTPNSFIVDEYGARISVEEMRDTIVNRKYGGGTSFSERFKPDAFYRSEAEFHRVNYSEIGPNGLLRTRVQEGHCIGHGSGTWDLIIGEFS